MKSFLCAKYQWQEIASQFYQALVILCLLSFFLPGNLWGQEEEDAESLDVVLLVDSSGSMLVTDPQNLSREGSRLFVSLLDEADHISLVTFDRAPIEKFPLGKVNREAFERTLIGLESRGRYTDIGLAIEKAGEILDRGGRPDSSKIIVLLSDGRFDPHPERGSATTLSLSLLEGTLPAMLSKGIRVHTLSFSPQADKNFLEKIALKTGGLYWHTPTAEDIHESFVELLLAAKRPQLIGLGQKGVFIDELVEEATFYVTREDNQRVTLVDPSGTPFSAVVKEPSLRWYSGRKFDVITVTEPAAGTWTIKGANLNEGFATVLTKLKLKASWPSYVVAGEPTLLEVQLYDDERPLALTSMNALVNYEFQISSTDIISEPRINESLRDDGMKGDRRKGDGVYSALVALDPGGYQLKISAKSPTFERERIVPFQVRPSMVSLSLADNAAGEGSVFVVDFDDQGEKFTSVAVVLEAQKEGSTWELPLEKESPNSFFAADRLLKEGGLYILRAKATAVKKSGDVVVARSKSLRFRKEVKIRVALPTAQPTEEVEEASQEETDEPINFVPYLIGATLLNAITGGGAYYYLRKKFSVTVSLDEIPALPEDIYKIAEKIEERASLSEVDFGDPYYRVQSEQVSAVVQESEDEQDSSLGGEESVDSMDEE
jgi:uncharacterized protein (TIGR03503 family)